MFSHVPKEQVISLPDVSTLYAVPVMLKEFKLDEWFCERLCFDLRRCDFRAENALLSKYRLLAER